MASKGPDLMSYVDRSVSISLNKGRRVTGTLRGYDQFMNLVLENAYSEEVKKGNNVSSKRETIGTVMIRGNSIAQFELVQ